MNQKLNPTIWEDIKRAAKLAGIESNTVSQWKLRRFVPPSMHYTIVECSLQLQLDITHKKLHDMWKNKNV